MSCDDSVKNKHDIFRLTRLNGEKRILSAFFRLCNISVVKFQCPTYTFYSDFLKIDFFFPCQLVLCDTVPLAVILPKQWNLKTAKPSSIAYQECKYQSQCINLMDTHKMYASWIISTCKSTYFINYICQQFYIYIGKKYEKPYTEWYVPRTWIWVWIAFVYWLRIKMIKDKSVGYFSYRAFQ